jgi:hypothetical protein
MEIDLYNNITIIHDIYKNTMNPRLNRISLLYFDTYELYSYVLKNNLDYTNGCLRNLKQILSELNIGISKFFNCRNIEESLEGSIFYSTIIIEKLKNN